MWTKVQFEDCVESASEEGAPEMGPINFGLRALTN